MCIINVWYGMVQYGDGIGWFYLCIVFPGSGWCLSIYSLVSGKKEVDLVFIHFYVAFPKFFGDFENPEQTGLTTVLTCSEQRVGLTDLPASLSYPVVL